MLMLLLCCCYNTGLTLFEDYNLRFFKKFTECAANSGRFSLGLDWKLCRYQIKQYNTMAFYVQPFISSSNRELLLKFISIIYFVFERITFIIFYEYVRNN